ncbi:hypothetical protein AKUA2103_PHAGE100570 (plasmid) [Apilactobacillus kunkeei]|nr:hypothetical protein AKUA2103_PHAGE100570 [Apilactobacillus kunkeei]CAI2699822.1 hypothetical protein AKUA1003_PHAGE100570 [Apilactobacillus kunkeei]
MIYVKISEKNAPYIDLISFEPQEGFIEKNVDESKMPTLINFTNKCWVDKDGEVQVSNDKVMTEADVKNQALQMQLKMMQIQFSNLILNMAKGGNK